MPTKPVRQTAARKATRKPAATTKKQAKRTSRSGKVTFETVREIFAEMPGVEEGLCYGTPGFRVKKKFLSRLKEDGESLVVPVGDLMERDLLLEADPAVFYITDHYRDWPTLLVRLSKVDRAELRDLLERVWRAKAPKRLLQAYDEGR